MLPSLPEVKPRSVIYKYYEIRGEPLKAKIKDKYFFEAPVGNYLVLFNALGFQQDLIKHVEVRKGHYSLLKVHVRREVINVYSSGGYEHESLEIFAEKNLEMIP
jgi:hypothetical protein